MPPPVRPTERVLPREALGTVGFALLTGLLGLILLAASGRL